MAQLTKLTPEYKRRVEDSLKETQSLLNKELRYKKDLQNKERIKQLQGHIIKLNYILENGWNGPKFD